MVSPFAKLVSLYHSPLTTHNLLLTTHYFLYRVGRATVGRSGRGGRTIVGLEGRTVVDPTPVVLVVLVVTAVVLVVLVVLVVVLVVLVVAPFKTSSVPSETWVSAPLLPWTVNRWFPPETDAVVRTVSVEVTDPPAGIVRGLISKSPRILVSGVVIFNVTVPA